MGFTAPTPRPTDFAFLLRILSNLKSQISDRCVASSEILDLKCLGRSPGPFLRYSYQSNCSATSVSASGRVMSV
jgi:hypothetical protein